MNKFEHSNIGENASQESINKEIEKFVDNIIFNNYGDTMYDGSKNMSFVLRIIKEPKLFKNYYNKNILLLSHVFNPNEHGMELIKKTKFRDKFFRKKRENSQIRDYMYAEYELADFMSMLGYKFNKTESKHINMLASAFHINGRKIKKSKEFDVDNFNRLKDMIEICSDDEKTKAYIKKYITTTYRDDYVLDAIKKLIILKKDARICLPDNITKNMKLIDVCLNMITKVDFVQNKENQKKDLDIALINKIKEQIEPNIPRQQLPFELYKALNKVLSYDTTMFEMPQNPNIPVIDRVYNKPIDSITEENNRVACKAWAQMYTYLLNSYGITAYSVGKFHKGVMFFDENNDMCIADATDGVFEDFQMFRMPDMNRSKLNINPLNFYKVSVNDKFQFEKLYYRDGQFVTGNEIQKNKANFRGKERDMFFGIVQDSKSKIVTDKEALQKVFKMIDEKRTIPQELVRVESYEKDIVNKQKLDLLSYLVTNLTKEYETDDLLKSNLINNLFYMLFKNKKNVGKLARSLYKVNEKKSTEIVPICYIKQKLNKVYYIWNNNEGFIEISKEELEKKIREGELFVEESEKRRYVISGIKNPKKTLSEKVQALEDR